MKDLVIRTGLLGRRSRVALVIATMLVALLPASVALAAGPTSVTTPAGATGGTPFGTQPVVSASGGGTMSLAIATGPSGAHLTGCNTPADSGGGTYTFTGCTLDLVGTYTLTATWSLGGSITTGSFTVAVGPAARLAFLQGPTAAVANVAIAPAVTVQILDAGGNLTPSTASVSIAITANPGGGTLSGTLARSGVAGVATFGDLSINKAGAGYALAASSTGLAGATSGSFAISHGAAAQLGFIQQPSRGLSGGLFTVQPIVAIEDASGNVVDSAPSTAVTLAIGTNAGGGSLYCPTNPLSTTNGVATFGGCRIGTVGVGYTLVASGTYAPATSAPFDVADRVVFSGAPAGAVAGVAFTTQPIVQVRAGATNFSANDSTTPITLAIYSGPAGATLTCTTNPITVISGVASFAASGCRLDKAGTYTLVVSAPNLTVDYTTVTVVAGPPTKLGFTAQPSSGGSRQSFPIQPVVAIQDAGGNTVTTGAFSTALVTLAIGSNPAAGTLTCAGGLIRYAVLGLATFSGCQIDNAGAGYTLVATTTALAPATTGPFPVTAPVAVITISASTPVITWATGVTLGVQFAQNGASKAFTLQGTSDGVNWATLTSLTADASGHASLVYRPATNLYYRAVFSGTPDLLAATSNTTRVVVRQIALLRPTSSGVVRTVSRNTSVTFTTTVRPVRSDLAPAKVTFVVYHQVNGTWKLAAKTDVLINSAGLAKYTWKFSSSGSWYVRSIVNPTPANANSIWSQVERYNVN